MVEADFQTKFSKWAKYNIKYSGAFELKLTKTSSIPFSSVADHQILNLKIAKHSNLVYKIMDVGLAQKPFDCFTLSNVQAYVVLMFYKRGQKEFFMIDIDDFIKEKETSDRKSLLESRAREIGVSRLLEGK